MSSSAIMALIRKKEAELEKLKGTDKQMTTVCEAADCMANKFTSAGELMSEAGSIGGKPFDNGATLVVAKDLNAISNNALDLSGQIKGAISDLQSEIQGLYAAYEAALARERAEAEKARRAAAAKAAGKK